MPWVNPRWQLSATQLLTRSLAPPLGWGGQWKGKSENLGLEAKAVKQDTKER